VSDVRRERRGDAQAQQPLRQRRNLRLASGRVEHHHRAGVDQLSAAPADPSNLPRPAPAPVRMCARRMRLRRRRPRPPVRYAAWRGSHEPKKRARPRVRWRTAAQLAHAADLPEPRAHPRLCPTGTWAPRMITISSSCEPTSATAGQTPTTAPTGPLPRPCTAFAASVAAMPSSSSYRASTGDRAPRRAASSIAIELE
jgi:hypothetical protein